MVQAFWIVLLVGTSWTSLSFAQGEAAPEEKPAAPDAEPAAEAKPQTAAEQAAAAEAAQEKDADAPDAAKPAEEPSAPKPEDALAPGEGDDFGHGGQFGIRAGLVGGYRMVFRYDKSPYCTKPDPIKGPPKEQQKFCGHAGPLAIDLGLSFAPLDGIEPFLWGRFGLSGESETNTQPLVLVGAGLRVYTMSDSKFKIFIEPAVAVELEKGAGNPDWNYGGLNPEYKTDMVFHLAAGPQFDVAKAFGFYLNAGISTGVLRAIHSSLELQGGVQLRVP